MNRFFRGLRAGIPIGIGYLSVSFTFGIMAVSYGLSWWQALLVSMTTVTSAGQLAGVEIMRFPGLYFDLLLSQLTINLRYSFMSIAVSQKADSKFKGIYRWLLGFFMTDEIFAVASNERNVTRAFFSGLAIAPYIGWSLGTLLGAVLGNILPGALMSALSLAIYGMFIAIVVPEVKGEWSIAAVAGVALVLSCIFEYLPLLSSVGSGIAISICAVVAAAFGAILFPVREEETL